MMDLPDTLASAFRARILVDAKLKPMVADLALRPELQKLSELSTPAGQEELINHIKRLVQVDAVTRRVYRLSYDAKDPELARRVVQNLAEMGVADVIAQRNQSAERARAFLTAETDQARQRMLDAESDVVQFVRSHPKLLVSMSGADRNKLGLGAADKLLVSGRAHHEPPPLKALETTSTSPEMRALLVERAQQEATVAQFEASQRFDPLQQKVSELDRVNQQIAELKAQRYTPEYPEFRRLNGELERLQQDIRDIRSKRDPRLAADMLAVDSAKAKITAIDKQLALQRRKVLGGGMPGADDQVLSAEAVYARLYRELETSRAAYEKLRERELDAQINEQLAKVKGNPAARVEDPATRPTGPRGVSRKMMMALCIALGLLAGLLAGAGRALTDARIYTVFDLSRSSRLPVLGRLPPDDSKQGWAVLDQPEVVLPAEPGGAPPRGYEGRIVWPRQVLTLPSTSSLPKLAATSSTRSALSLSGPVAPVQTSHKTPPSRKTPPSGEYMIVSREPAGDPPIPDAHLAALSGGHAIPGGKPASQESAIAKWRAAASQKSGALHLSALGYQVRLGELPKPPPPELVLLSAPEGARAEQYRLLRLRLQEQGDPRMLVIASSRPGEGKTLCSLNLALAYAEGGGPKVVLVDANLSSPRLSSLLGVPARGAAHLHHAAGERGTPQDGVINVATDGLGEAGVEAVGDLRSGSPEVWQYLPNLFLVPASALGDRAHRTAILSSPEFAGLLADLREAFDYVIIDVPAISEAADAKLVLRHADAGILLVRAHKTTSTVVSTALDRLGRGTVSGAVLNVFS
jgi:Mrp family chromosome partitioning ATPase/uncharacterized protein involved in exopolysaccharide biosynthesis